GPWRTAVKHALDALVGRYRRADGLYRTLANDDGAPLDDRAFLYDQAFVLLALASATQAGIEPERCIAEANELRELVYKQFARKEGGFREQELRGSTFQSNPHMHLLESALAWSSIEPDGEWQRL